MDAGIRSGADEGDDWLDDPGVTDDEVECYLMGPFDGQVPGLVRRIRRILDVSQRGLAALLKVSQSVVARWETGRTSPRVSALVELLRLARLRVNLHDIETGEEARPMRDDGARDRAGRRYPAHVDLTVRGWWYPRGVESTTDIFLWRERSRTRRDPRVRFYTSPAVRFIERITWGTPDDHPSDRQLLAEALHQDEAREGWREQLWAASPWLRPVTPARPDRPFSA